MPVLKDSRRELFCQEKALGKTHPEAYLAAGFDTTNPVSTKAAANRLARDPKIRARIAELLEGTAEKAEITLAEWLIECKRIGFSDIRNVVKWKGGKVTLKDADDLKPEYAATIAELSETDKGALKVKLHSKVDALEKIGRHLGAYRDKIELTGKDGGPIEISDIEAARRVAFLLAKGVNETG